MTFEDKLKMAQTEIQPGTHTAPIRLLEELDDPARIAQLMTDNDPNPHGPIRFNGWLV